MNPQGTSFIPQRPVQSQATKKVVRKVYVLTYISYILFFGTVFSSVAIFAYSTLLDSQIDAQKERLVQEEGKYNQEQIDEVRRLDTKIKIAADRMDLHLSLLPFFDALEQNVSSQILLKTFKYIRTNDAAPQVELTGEVNVLNSLVFQREVLQFNPILAGAQFGEVALASAPILDSEGVMIDDYETTVSFWLKKNLDISLLQYKPRAPEVVVESLENSVVTETEPTTTGEEEI